MEVRNVILCGDVIDKLKELPDKSVHCLVTSLKGRVFPKFVQTGICPIFSPSHNQLWIWTHSNKITNATSNKRKMRVCHLEWIDPLIDKLFDEIA